MKKIFLASLGALLVPGIALAANDVQGFLSAFMGLLNSAVVPFLFALAFLFFLVNTVRYFIIGGDKEDARKKAKTLALWGIIAFVLMVSIWGIVNMLISGFGVGRNITPCPDFICRDRYGLDPRRDF